jgi:hypothetical protein
MQQCATPGCATLTFGEICLGCMQRKAKAHAESDPPGELRDGNDSPSEPATATA